jgi:hypothetical protein
VLIALTLSTLHHKALHVVIVYSLVEYDMCSCLSLYIASTQPGCCSCAFLESSTSSRRTLPLLATCGGRPCLLSAIATRYVCYIKDLRSCNNITTLFSFGTVFWYSLSQCMCVNFQLRRYSIHSSLPSNSGVTHFTLHPSGEMQITKQKTETKFMMHKTLTPT